LRPHGRVQCGRVTADEEEKLIDLFIIGIIIIIIIIIRISHLYLVVVGGVAAADCLSMYI